MRALPGLGGLLLAVALLPGPWAFARIPAVAPVPAATATTAAAPRIQEWTSEKGQEMARREVAQDASVGAPVNVSTWSTGVLDATDLDDPTEPTATWAAVVSTAEGPAGVLIIDADGSEPSGMVQHDAELAAARYSSFSLHTSVRLLVHSQELAGLTAPAPDACTRALNVLAAVAVVSRDAALGGLPAVAPARDKALATVLVGLWADIQIGPLPPACADAPLLDALPERLAAQPQILAGPGETGLGPNLPRVINRLFWSAKGRRIPEDWLDSVDRDLRALEATEAAGDPLLIGRYEAVLAICRAWVSLLGPEAADPVAEELAAFSGEPPGFDKWLARTVLSAMSRPTGLRRLFGAR